jgi:hypothetical protein
MDEGLFNKIARTMRKQFPNASDDLLLEKAYQEYDAEMKRRSEYRKGIADGSIKPFKHSGIFSFLNKDDDDQW